VQQQQRQQQCATKTMCNKNNVQQQQCATTTMCNNNNTNQVSYQLFAVTGLAHQMRARRGGMVNRRAPHGHVGQRLRDNSDNIDNSDNSDNIDNIDNRDNASGSRRG
jgi:hypothetical protein